MKKIMAVFIIGLLFCAFSAGCAGRSSNEKKIIGTWEYRITSPNAVVYLNYVFKKNGTGKCRSVHIQKIEQGDFDYMLDEEGTILFVFSNNVAIVGEYAFGEEEKTLSLTVNGVTYELKKAEN